MVSVYGTSVLKATPRVVRKGRHYHNTHVHEDQQNENIEPSPSRPKNESENRIHSLECLNFNVRTGMLQFQFRFQNVQKIITKIFYLTQRDIIHN